MAPDARFHCDQAPQYKTAKIEFHEQRDTTDEPRNHDKHGQLSVGRVSQERDVISEGRQEAKNHQRVQTTEDKPCQCSYPQPSGKVPHFQPESSKDRTVMDSPQGKGEIGNDLRSELNQRLFLEPVGKGIVINGCGDRQQRQRRSPFFCLDRIRMEVRLRLLLPPWISESLDCIDRASWPCAALNSRATYCNLRWHAARFPVRSPDRVEIPARSGWYLSRPSGVPVPPAIAFPP